MEICACYFTQTHYIICEIIIQKARVWLCLSSRNHGWSFEQGDQDINRFSQHLKRFWEILSYSILICSRYSLQWAQQFSWAEAFCAVAAAEKDHSHSECGQLEEQESHGGLLPWVANWTQKPQLNIMCPEKLKLWKKAIK